MAIPATLIDASRPTVSRFEKKPEILSDVAARWSPGNFGLVAAKLSALVVDWANSERLGRFWLDPPEQPVVDAVGTRVALNLGDDVAAGVLPTQEAKRGKKLLHLDLASTSVAYQAALVGRACSLGAPQVDISQGAVPWVVLADPEGNEFCVLEPREEYMDTGPVAAVMVDSVDTIDPPQLLGPPPWGSRRLPREDAGAPYGTA